jgi:hypothetical protein
MSPLEMPLMGYAPLTTPLDDNGSQMANGNFPPDTPVQPEHASDATADRLSSVLLTLGIFTAREVFSGGILNGYVAK